jgi:hypothetical protein
VAFNLPGSLHNQQPVVVPLQGRLSSDPNIILTVLVLYHIDLILRVLLSFSAGIGEDDRRSWDVAICEALLSPVGEYAHETNQTSPQLP